MAKSGALPFGKNAVCLGNEIKWNISDSPIGYAPERQIEIGLPRSKTA